MQLLILRPKYLRWCMQVSVIPLLFLLSSGAMAENESTDSLSLDAALSLSLNAHPDIAIALREREAMDGVQMQAGARPNPTISAMVQDTRSATRETTLQFNQEFELGNKRQARMEAAGHFYSKATAELESRKAEIHADVVAAFYEVLAAQERLELAKSSVEIAGLALDAASKRVIAGKSSPVEETKSRIAESAVKIELSQATSQLASSRKRLAAMWGNPLPVFANAQGQLAEIPEIADINELNGMVENAPAIRAAQIEIAAREAIAEVERSKAIPNVTMTAGVVNNQELGHNQALLGLSVPIPVFDRNQGNLQEAISRKYKAQDELVALKSRLAVDLTSQHERLNAARHAAESIKSEILPGAQSALDAAGKGFKAGKFGFLDVLDAQRTLFQARSQYIQVLLEAHQAVAEIERILGDVIPHQSNAQEVSP